MMLLETTMTIMIALQLVRFKYVMILINIAAAGNIRP